MRGRESINNLFGPVGIVTANRSGGSYGWQDLLELLALITINLGVFNLLPFPALDGGKVVFLIIEGVTGHAVPEKLQGTLVSRGLAPLLARCAFATYNDIIRLVTGAMWLKTERELYAAVKTEVKIGYVIFIGGKNPVAVQTMLNVPVGCILRAMWRRQSGAKLLAVRSRA